MLSTHIPQHLYSSVDQLHMLELFAFDCNVSGAVELLSVRGFYDQYYQSNVDDLQMTLLHPRSWSLLVFSNNLYFSFILFKINPLDHFLRLHFPVPMHFRRHSWVSKVWGEVWTLGGTWKECPAIFNSHFTTAAASVLARTTSFPLNKKLIELLAWQPFKSSQNTHMNNQHTPVSKLSANSSKKCSARGSNCCPILSQARLGEDVKTLSSSPSKEVENSMASVWGGACDVSEFLVRETLKSLLFPTSLIQCFFWGILILKKKKKLLLFPLFSLIPELFLFCLF